jgi:hypothetical protein
MPSNQHFASALQELIEKRPVQGLFARCFAETEGDEAKTKAKYIALRAVEIQEQERIANLTDEEKKAIKDREIREVRENLLRKFTFDLFKQQYRREIPLHYYGRDEKQQMFEEWRRQKLEAAGYYGPSPNQIDSFLFHVLPCCSLFS